MKTLYATIYNYLCSAAFQDDITLSQYYLFLFVAMNQWGML